MRPALLVVLSSLLTGCVATAQREYVTARDACLAARDAGRIKTETATVLCAQAAHDRLIAPLFPYRDLLEVQRYEALAVAREVDQGRMTREEAMAEYARTAARINDMAVRRSALIAASTPDVIYVPQRQPPPSSVLCTAMGGHVMTTVTCH
jgi:hypothetical protein